MASRKDEKERLRAERLAAEQQEAADARRRLVAGYALAGLLGLAVLVGLVVVIAGSGGGGSGSGGTKNACPQAHIVGGPSLAGASTNGVPVDCRKGTKPPPVKYADLNKAAKVAHCDLQLNLPDEGNTHVTHEVHYGTNPPTSGDHNPIPQADGAYSAYPDDEHTTHTLEHGRVEIQYSPKLSDQDQLALLGVFDDSPGGMMIYPNPHMPYEVAVTAWTQLVGCKKYSPAVLDVIRDFRDQFRGKGPEPIPFPNTPSDFQ
jgi:hypothetical protein